MRQPRGRQPDLGVTKSFAGLAQNIRGRHAQVVEPHHRVTAGEGAVQAVHGADDLDAGLVHVGQEHGRVTVLALRHDDREGGAVGAGDEPFFAVDDVMIAVLARRGQHRRRIGAGARRGLGHAEAGAGRAGRQRTQPALLLFLGRHDLHQMHVAFVGREDMHRDRTEQRIAGFLEHDRLADMVQAEAAPFGADMRRQQARLAAERHQFLAELLGGAVMGLALVALQRNDFVADESACALLQLLQLGGQGEIHQNARPWAISWVNSRMPVPIAVNGA